MSPRYEGFTLLEVCLALMVGVLLITLALPSIISVLGEQRLKHSFEGFDRFVQDAKLKSPGTGLHEEHQGLPPTSFSNRDQRKDHTQMRGHFKIAQ